jgi:threonine/homoserine/homoserine lactone efflux protein
MQLVCDLIDPFLTSFALNVIAALAPGPDFLLVLRCAAIHGRSAGLAAAAGIGCGLLVFAAIALLATSVLITVVPAVSETVRIAGVVYLGYLGVSLVLSHGDSAGCLASPHRWRECLLAGFLTDVTNPKVFVFYLAIMPQFEAARSGQASLVATFAGAIAGAITVFAGVSILGGRTQAWMTPARIRCLDRASGLLLLGFAGVALAYHAIW